VNYEEILVSASCATIPCVLFDHLLYALQKWQRTRMGVYSPEGFGPIGRTMMSLVFDFFACVVVAYIYPVVGHHETDAFLVGACLWLTVTIPVLFTSRYVEESQKQFLAGRILGWLVKTIIASTSAALLITIGS